MDRPPSRRNRSVRTFVLACVAALALGGCSSDGGVREAFKSTLQAVGLKSDEPQPKVVPVRLYAGDNLNAGDTQRGVALVTRVYQLRALDRFQDAPFKAFLDEELEQIALGDDLIEVTEVLLTPGQRHEILQQLPADGRYLGVVALFRTPSTSRWRFAFDAGQAAADGITVGLHACAMTTASEALVTGLATEPHRLSSVNCVAPER